MPDTLRGGLERYFSPGQLARLRSVRIGIAGVGGLGSNAAILLARSGIEKFLLIDPDVVEPSNLNRQHFWPRQVGMPKVEAMREHLRRLSGHVEIETMQCRLTLANLPRILPRATIWMEALDEAAVKKSFVDWALASGSKVVCASGIAGCGGDELRKRQLGNMIAVGDFRTSIDDAPPLAPRVIQAAAMMSDSVLKWVLDGAEVPGQKEDAGG